MNMEITVEHVRSRSIIYGHEIDDDRPARAIETTGDDHVRSAHKYSSDCHQASARNSGWADGSSGRCPCGVKVRAPESHSRGACLRGVSEPLPVAACYSIWAIVCLNNMVYQYTGAYVN